MIGRILSSIIAPLVAVNITLANLAVAFAQPLEVGRIEPLGIKVGSFSNPNVEGIVWSSDKVKSIQQSATKSIRLHFTDIKDHSAGNYTVIIRDRDQKVVGEIPKSRFGSLGDYWSDLIAGSGATVVIRAASPPIGLDFEIKEFSFSLPSGGFLDAIWPDERQQIREFTDRPLLLAAAKSVALIDYFRDGKRHVCSGFMISDDTMMTNLHCIDSHAVCKTAKVIFGFEEAESGWARRGPQFDCVQFIPPAKKNLDYALIKLNGEPGQVAKWGRLALSTRTVTAENVVMIHHPNDEPKQVSEKDCKVQTPTADGDGEGTDFGHICDTMRGSSGSPILDPVTFEVIGLHHRGFDQTGRWANENRAVKMQLIVSDLPTY